MRIDTDNNTQFGIETLNKPLNHHSVEAVKYTTTAVLALGALGLLYYFDVCQVEKDFAYSCGTASQSFKVNLGLPIIALAAIYKAHKAFINIWN